MRNSISIINWPLRASTTPTAPVRRTHPSPYQPHNGYKKEHQDRKRLIYSLVGLAFALFSLVASITFYILIGVEEQKGGWLFRTWVVVSAGLSTLLGLLVASYYYNHVKTKRAEERTEDDGTELRALGRREIEQENQSITRMPLVQDPGSPVTVLHHDDSTEIQLSSPGAADHVFSSPDSPAGPSYESSTHKPPPRFPSPAKLRDQSRADGDAVYHTSSVAGSPDTISSSKSPEALLARQDSLKKLREATVRRKKALESLN